mmetsp:Transcript_3019/g.8725  ORF Transcript_3019/g.8725 Transcript_3019/m.8725 type:complete len:262 (+) Transcript_3019:41-826(+)
MANKKEKKPATAADSDEEDEDYVPPAEGQSDDEGADGVTSGGAKVDDDAGRPRLPTHKQRAVDEAFESLFGKPPPAADGASSAKKGKKKGAKSKKAMKKKKNLLSSMFGSSAAGKLMSTSGAVTKADSDSRKRDRPLQGLEKKVVTETKVFAGKEIEVTRTVVRPTGSTAASAAGGGGSAPGGIDAVLANLGGPQKLSTVSKTSSDWDTFKDKTGLDDELEEKAKGKDAYLVKKDFLDRVDQRTFEVEKAERDRERAARGR